MQLAMAEAAAPVAAAGMNAVVEANTMMEFAAATAVVAAVVAQQVTTGCPRAGS